MLAILGGLEFVSVSESSDEVAALAAFHDGGKAVMERCYRDHFDTVARAVAGFARGADAETLIHEIFFKLLSSSTTRQGFRGGSMTAWLAQLARNHCIDWCRKHRRELLVDNPTHMTNGAALSQPGDEADTLGRDLIARTRERVPSALRDVFELRCVQGLSQREAALQLGMRRTTLAYQELRVLRIVRKFLLKELRE